MNFVHVAMFMIALALAFLSLVHIRDEKAAFLKIFALAFVVGVECVLQDNFLPLPEMIVLWRMLGAGLVVILFMTIWAPAPKKVCQT